MFPLFLLVLIIPLYSMEFDNSLENVPFEDALNTLTKKPEAVIITIYDDSKIEDLNKQIVQYQPKYCYFKHWRDRMAVLFSKAENKNDHMQFQKLSHNSIMTALQEVKSDILTTQHLQRYAYFGLGLAQCCLTILLLGHLVTSHG